jgi:hypothetical protein
MLIGAITGAMDGELLTGTRGRKALRAGWGVFVGNTISVGPKFAFSGVILFCYGKKMAALKETF